MNKKIKKFKISTAIIFGFEIISLVSFMLLYIFNIFNLKTYVKSTYFLYITIAFVVLDMLYLLSVLYSVFKVRQKSDIRTVDILGNDIKEAYAFGLIGFVVVDENDIVLWESDILLQKQSNIINKNIFPIIPYIPAFLVISNFSSIIKTPLYYSYDYNIKNINKKENYRKS